MSEEGHMSGAEESHSRTYYVDPKNQPNIHQDTCCDKIKVVAIVAIILGSVVLIAAGSIYLTSGHFSNVLKTLASKVRRELSESGSLAIKAICTVVFSLGVLVLSLLGIGFLGASYRRKRNKGKELEEQLTKTQKEKNEGDGVKRTSTEHGPKFSKEPNEDDDSEVDMEFNLEDKDLKEETEGELPIIKPEGPEELTHREGQDSDISEASGEESGRDSLEIIVPPLRNTSDDEEVKEGSEGGEDGVEVQVIIATPGRQKEERVVVEEEVESEEEEGEVRIIDGKTVEGFEQGKASWGLDEVSEVLGYKSITTVGKEIQSKKDFLRHIQEKFGNDMNIAKQRETAQEILEGMNQSPRRRGVFRKQVNPHPAIVAVFLAFFWKGVQADEDDFTMVFNALCCEKLASKELSRDESAKTRFKWNGGVKWPVIKAFMIEAINNPEATFNPPSQDDLPSMEDVSSEEESE